MAAQTLSGGSPEVFCETARGEFLLVAGQIHGHQVVPMRQQGIQFTVTGLRVVSAAHDADHLGANPGFPLGRHDTVGHRLHHTGRIETVGIGHEPGAEPQFDVVDAFALRVLDVFVSHAPAGIQVVQDGRQPPEAADEVHQAGGLAVHHDVRSQ
jgi:hypothetical protein